MNDDKSSLPTGSADLLGPSPKDHPSQPPPQYQPSPTFGTQLACVSFSSTDRLRLHDFPPHEVEAVREMVAAEYARGVQDVRMYAGATEIKLCGNPWTEGRWGDPVGRKLVRSLLRLLYGRGWLLQAPVGMCGDSDTLFFRFQSSPPPPCEWLIVSPEDYDRLLIIGPQPESPPPGLADAIIQTLDKVKSYDVKDGALLIKFKGYPWRASGEDAVGTRTIILSVLRTLERFGWSLYGSVNLEGAGDGADAMYFRKRRDWTPGGPV